MIGENGDVHIFDESKYLAIMRVSLSGVSVKKKMMTVIAEELVDNSKYKDLQTLSLSRCGLTDAACAILGDKGLLKNNNLRSLYLNKNKKITNIGLESILNGLVQHESMDSLWLNSLNMNIDHCKAIGTFFGRNPRLRSMRMESCGIQDEWFEYICQGLVQNRHLKCLIAPVNNLTDKGMSFLVNVLKSDLSGLIIIDMARNYLGNECGRILAEGTGASSIIESIDLSGNIDLKDQSVIDLCESLKDNESLYRMRLNNCGLSDICCKGLAQVLANHFSLQMLEIRGNVNITGHGMKLLKDGISQNHHLRFLNLSLLPKLGKLGGVSLKEACLKQVRSTKKLIGTVQKMIEKSDFNAYEVVAKEIVEYVGYTCINEIDLQSSYKTLHLPGIDDLVIMQTILKDECGHTIKITW